MFGVVLAAVAVLAAGAQAVPGGRPGTVGDYDLDFKGDFTGSGTAKINPAHLTFKVELQGVNGPGGTLDVPKLKVENGRFNGTGTLGGQPVDITGRVDAGEGGVVSVNRLVVTIRTKDGRVARAFGESSNGKKNKN